MSRLDLTSMRRFQVIIAVMVLSSLSVDAQDNYAVDSTQYLIFYNDPWINLHHFLYQKAKGTQEAHLQEDGNELMDIGEDSIWKSLTPSELVSLTLAVNHYQQEIVEKSLFDLVDIRLALQRQVGSQISDTIRDVNYTRTMNDAFSVYRDRFWPVHNAHNTLVLAKHIALVRALEPTLMTRMETFAGLEWPEQALLRVDLTAYANYAGAYTVARPVANTVISTLDPEALGTAMLETIFHEPSHLLYSRNSAFRSRIYHHSQELEMEFPRGLWHAVQFYLCGRLVQNELSGLGVEHKLTMDERAVFTEYNTPQFRTVLERYYKGETDIETTVTNLLMALKE